MYFRKKLQSKLIILLLFTLLKVLGPTSLSATSSSTSIFDLLSYQEVIKMDLSFDLNAVRENRRLDSLYKGNLAFSDEMGRPQSWEVKISLRGRFRRMHCQEMPPLRIDFSKKDLAKAGLAPFDDLKLVTYCMDDDPIAKEALLKEYLAYKLYNEITTVSYRVQLASITFRDISTDQNITQYAFLIEDNAQLRDRIGASKVDTFRVTEKESFEPYHLRATSLFQYMIGNKDWGLTFSKNVKYLNKGDKVVVVPYDFDFAALVGAPYNTPIEGNDAEYFSRAYLGFKEDFSALQPAINEFVNKRDRLNQIIKSCKLLKSSTRKAMITYLDHFFENIDDLDFQASSM